jgi:hypothetical protein
VGAALSVWGVADSALAAGPFHPFIGSWRGGGKITSKDGRQEPITWRATYEGEDGDRSLIQSLVCASDAFRLSIESSAVAEGGALRGEWRETTRNVRGKMSGEIDHGDFQGQVSGFGFTAQISIRASGHRQAVSIRPSAGDIRGVDIVMTRAK